MRGSPMLARIVALEAAFLVPVTLKYRRVQVQDPAQRWRLQPGEHKSPECLADALDLAAHQPAQVPRHRHRRWHSAHAQHAPYDLVGAHAFDMRESSATGQYRR